MVYLNISVGLFKTFHPLFLFCLSLAKSVDLFLIRICCVPKTPMDRTGTGKLVGDSSCEVIIFCTFIMQLRYSSGVSVAEYVTHLGQEVVVLDNISLHLF